ncbi:MAG: hypothetical protein K8S25_13790 [Alphaproteobacteria bacterium]|nr:hypothetical protein [Alphaproteobacteria bacterium]
MRNLLLASAAVAIMGVGPAMAAGSDSVTVTTFLAQSCSVSIPGTDVALPPGGGLSLATSFSYQCNYGGEAAVATVTYDSGYDGVSDDLGVTDHEYNIIPSFGSSGTSAAPLINAAAAVTAPNSPQNVSFQLSLVTPIIVAGTYTDTLTISIAP